MGRVSHARENLIEAVMELIWTGSYGSTSVEQICDRAGVKKGSFYYFFESKTALAVIAIDHSWGEFSKELDAIFSSAFSPLDRIINCSRYLRSEQEERLKQHGRVLGCPIHSLGAEVSTVDLQLRDRLQEVLSQFISYYETAIRDGQKEGTVVAGDPQFLANLSFSFCEGQLLHARMQNDLSPLDDVEAGLRHILAVSRPLPLISA
ncbi:MAG: TetR/AcrR family transcriptional regulator [Verrucomicrobiales bacterium]|jgi:TetR/AcrR family transcriptional repressor of nem operon|nr:TetR/AcrR family transcriptional regulator [Verrucomicrobiales bacterium]MBP9223029.1 TetR/AcrR family transcriptional regulator [Verrucomicrobiales bacterium]HQZ29254.1 TetR/AcrR family transcriptional regulator [Verrucomicrobiales bacterium]